MTFTQLIKPFKSKITFFYLFFLLITFLVRHNSFFWDTIQLGSRHAHFYYNQNLNFSLLPDNIDSGHIPAFGYLLAAFWKLFGKNLLVSHLFILPFLFGIVYQSKRLISWFFNENFYWILIIFLADPTLLAQAVMVSPDIPLVFFMLMLLNGILYEKSAMKIIAATGLALISMRGWMVCTILFIFDAINLFFLSKKKPGEIIKQVACYIPGGLIALLFLFIHFKTKGWIGYHEDSPWAGSFEKVDLKFFIRNIFIYGWRLVDFGRIIWWIILFASVPYIYKQFKTNPKFQKLAVLSLLFLIIFPINMLMHKYLTQPRYFLPVYLFVSLSASFILYNRQIIRQVAPVVLIALMAGNFIVYPDKIAQGWDSSLAHLSYYKMRKETMQFMQENDITCNETKSWFPNLAPTYLIDLSDDTTGFSDKDLGTCSYCLYSNIFNDIEDWEYDKIMTWNLIYEQKKTGVKILLFKNPDK